MADKGKVWLIGAGPSDAGLFTIKGKHILEQADVVVYDKLAGQGVLGMIPPQAEKIDVGKHSGSHPVPQNDINHILLKLALQGKKVVRLKGGDPFLFGRGGEELELLADNGIPFEIVPGVTSAISVPAYAGIPVTHRAYASSLHIITGHTQKGGKSDIDFHSLAKLNGTLVFLMGVTALPVICEGLADAGMDANKPAAILERGTTAAQRRVVSTLSKLCDAARKEEIKPPSVIVIGEVCRLAEQLHWAEDRALGGMRVVNVRPADRMSRLTDMLTWHGAEVVEFPCIKTSAIDPNPALYQAVKNIKQYDWVAFTSPFGVDVFFEFLSGHGVDIRELAGIKIAAIGEATADRIRCRGIFVDYVPEVYSAVQLGTGLSRLAKGKRVLIPRAQDGAEDLTTVLEENAEYEDVPIYTTEFVDGHIDEVSDIVKNGEYDMVLFTSASTVRGFVGALPLQDYSKVNALCIGGQTASQAKKHGMPVTVAKQATLDGMLQALIQWKKDREKTC